MHKQKRFAWMVRRSVTAWHALRGFFLYSWRGLVQANAHGRKKSWTKHRKTSPHKAQGDILTSFEAVNASQLLETARPSATNLKKINRLPGCIDIYNPQILYIIATCWHATWHKRYVQIGEKKKEQFSATTYLNSYYREQVAWGGGGS